MNQNVVFGIDFILRYDLGISKLAKQNAIWTLPFAMQFCSMTTVFLYHREPNRADMHRILEVFSESIYKLSTIPFCYFANFFNQTIREATFWIAIQEFSVIIVEHLIALYQDRKSLENS